MKKFLSLALLGALVLGASSVVYANVCAFDPAPAATLLFPFVAYDYNGGTQGTTTVFSITNVSSEAQIVHVTLWTDFSVAILDFNIVLSGYDTQQLNIRDILLNGDLPVTGTDGALIVNGPVPLPDGPVSPGNDAGIPPWDGYFTSPPSLPDAQSTAVFNTTSPVDRCTPNNTSYPGEYAGGIPTSILGLFQGWLQSSQTNWRAHLECNYSSTVYMSDWFETRDASTPTWMYITADVVYVCNKLFPDSTGYWDPALDPTGAYIGGIAMYQNVLIGDVAWLNALDRFSEMDNAVHLEADIDLNTTPEQITGWPISFYHRYAAATGAFSDFREPLGTAWAFRYEGADPGDALTTYIRAFKAGTDPTQPPWFPLWDLLSQGDESPSYLLAYDCAAYTYYAWDEDENVNTTTQNPWSQPGFDVYKPNLLPLETQEVSVEWFNTVDDFGWMMFVWPMSNTAPVGVFLDEYQTWMGTKVVFNDYSASHDGAILANYNCFAAQQLPLNGINFDYVDIRGMYVGWNYGFSE